MERGTVSMRVALCYDLLRFSLCSGICAMPRVSLVVTTGLARRVLPILSPPPKHQQIHQTNNNPKQPCDCIILPKHIGELRRRVVTLPYPTHPSCKLLEAASKQQVRLPSRELDGLGLLTSGYLCDTTSSPRGPSENSKSFTR